MKIIIAPDSFKGSLTAKEAAKAIERGLQRSPLKAEMVLVPMADGGEGTAQSLVDATGGHMIQTQVTGPLGRTVNASYGILGDGRTAAIEMAAASGIQFVNEQTRNPLVTTTYGTGELISKALDQGAQEIIFGLGGSATNDGGAGMAQALGARLLDADGRALSQGGAALARLDRIDVSGLDPRLARTRIRLASDVTNPLTGPEGASAVFGPQKGADPSMVAVLDAALAHYAAVIRKDLHREVETKPGAGAAGGLGAGFLAFTPAVMASGVNIVVDTTHLKELARDADLCFTGEGSIDFQTAFGKTPMGTAQAVKESSPSCKVIALAGNVGTGTEELYKVGIDAIFSISPGAVSLEVAMAKAADNLAAVAENIGRLLA